MYCPFLLINKKRYAGLLYTKPERHDKMDTKVRFQHCNQLAMPLADAICLLSYPALCFVSDAVAWHSVYTFSGKPSSLRQTP